MSLAPRTSLARLVPSVSTWRIAIAALVGSSFVLACYTEAPAKKKKPFEANDDGFYGADITHEAEEPLGAWTNADSGAFGLEERPTDGTDRPPPPPPPPDGPKTICEGPLAMGDLVVTEIMIASKSGSGDTGEWVEIQSTRRDCWLKVEGVTIASPRGAATANSVTITEAFEVAPMTSFIVAGSADPAKNNNLPGKVFAWNATDVLKNDGDTISVKVGETVIDQLTYPSLTNVTGGRSVSFPSNCPATARSDWNRWSLSFQGFTGPLKATPNAWNNDVSCF